MNYDELEAGPEMDRLVAEAMGWKYSGFCRRGPVYIDLNEVEQECGSDWNPSSDADQAIEFATAKSACFVLFSPHTKEEGWLCSAQGYGHVGGTPGKAATPSLAICRAVLKMLAKDKS